MKKIFCILIPVVFCVLSSNAQTDFLNQDKMNSPSEFQERGYARVKVVFRHHGRGNCVCPGCACSGCKCPIGICICIPLSRPQNISENYELSQDDIDKGYGIAWAKTEGEQMHMIFETPNDDQGILPVDTSPYADATDAPKFNSSNPFNIENGNYTVTKTKYTYGEVVLRISY